MDGAATTAAPTPLKADCCGLLDALSATFKVVDLEPAAPGVSFIMIVQDELVASVLEQLPVPTFMKSPVFPPAFVTVIPVIENAFVFVSVKVKFELDNPTVTEPKLWLDGLSVTVPATPVPVSVAC
jgi:hypothetical protein